MAVKAEGGEKQHWTRRELKNDQYTFVGSGEMNTPGGSQKYATRRTLKARAGVRQLV